MICDHWVIQNKDSGEFETDEFGNVYHFSYYEEAVEYIEDHEMENVEVVPQF